MTTAWMDDALCVEVDRELFFPQPGASAREPKSICARCPVSGPCLAAAIERRHALADGSKGRLTNLHQVLQAMAGRA